MSSTGSDGLPESVTSAWVVNAAPTRRWPTLGIGQIRKHRELILFFAIRDVKVRYKQAFLGIAWAGLQPLIGALTFTLLFNRLAGIHITGRSYFAFALVGFSVWTYFSATVTSGASSLVSNAELLTKVAFPRLVAPVASMLPALIDLAVGAALAVVVAVVVGDGLSVIGIFIGLPLGIGLLLLVTAGPVLFFSASVVKYRDAAVLVGFGLQVLLFASPVAYPPELAPGVWQTVLYLNPVAGALGLLRAALIGTAFPTVGRLAISVVMAVLLLLVGLIHFRRNELEFADII